VLSALPGYHRLITSSLAPAEPRHRIHRRSGALGCLATARLLCGWISARSAGRRNIRGFGLPAWGCAVASLPEAGEMWFPPVDGPWPAAILPADP
jgi:hypothetical protein